MIPQNLNDWTEDTLLNLLTLCFDENDQLDFKWKLPDKRNNEDRSNLRRLCAAYANTDGGFIVYGVKDKKEGAVASDRLVGIPDNAEFNNNFGNYPAHCNPSVEWVPRNPPIKLANGNIAPVIHIPRSIRRPHCEGDSESGFKFPKRVNDKTLGMSLNEIRSAFTESKNTLQRLRSLEYELRFSTSMWNKQLVHVEDGEVNLIPAMMTALEGHIANPIVPPPELPLRDCSMLWQYAKILDNMAIIAASPGIDRQKENRDRIFVKHLETALKYGAKLHTETTTLLERLI